MLHDQGSIAYLEAVNKETLKNSYQRFQEEGVIEVTRKSDNGHPPKVRLAADWHMVRDPVTGEMQKEGKLWEFVGQITKYRRDANLAAYYEDLMEGVLSHVSGAGKILFEEALRHPEVTRLREGEVVEKTPKYKRKGLKKAML